MISVEDLKKELGSYTYEILTQDNDEVARRAIHKAKVWIEAMFMKCSKKPDFDNEIVKLAWMERTLYELYAIREQEEKAMDKKENAQEILSGILGDCAKEDKSTRNPLAFVKEGRLKWNGF